MLLWLPLLGFRVTRRFEKFSQFYKKLPKQSPIQKRPKFLQKAQFESQTIYIKPLLNH
jgi:hypothetical protein